MTQELGKLKTLIEDYLNDLHGSTEPRVRTNEVIGMIEEILNTVSKVCKGANSQMSSGEYTNDDGQTVWWAKSKLGKPGGFLAYEDTPKNWTVSNAIVKIEQYPPSEITLKAYDKNGIEAEIFTDCSNLRRLTFVHPCGDRCVVPICLDGPWSWIGEIDVIVRHGSDSSEHNLYRGIV